MFARRVTMHLKPESAAKFPEVLEKEILPLLRKQSGFQDEMVFLSQDGTKAWALSLWDRKESADTYVRETYPQIEKLVTPLVEGTPNVGSYNVLNSTFHKVAAPASA